MGDCYRESIEGLQMADTKLAGVGIQSANSIFQLQRQLFARSERVKGIDFHPTEPWILTTLYNGMILILPTTVEGS
jgi:hypothetical protein